MVEDDAEGWATLGFYNPAAPGSEDRLAALRFLTARGATAEDLRRGIVEDSLPSLPSELRRRQPRMSLRQGAERSDTPLSVAEQIAQAAGFVVADPDEEQFLTNDVEMFRLGAAGIEMFGLESTLQFARVAAAALAQIADAALTNFGQNVAPALDAEQASEFVRVEAADAATAMLLDGVPPLLSNLFFHACEAAIRRSLTSGTGATSDLTVGFLDLVGSSALAERLPPDEFGALMSGFERDATARVTTVDGRVVKMIGDEVMFVVTDAGAACLVALEIAEQVDAHPVLPRLRGALAAGSLVRGYGDFYGPVVNVAARAVKLAEPGAILVTDEVRQRAASSALSFEPLGDVLLRGLARPEALFRLRRL
jgi:adenylate cyclase